MEYELFCFFKVLKTNLVGTVKPKGLTLVGIGNIISIAVGIGISAAVIGTMAGSVYSFNQYVLEHRNKSSGNQSSGYQSSGNQSNSPPVIPPNNKSPQIIL